MSILPHDERLHSSLKERLKMAWHVFRGRPLLYRANIENGSIVITMPHTWVIRCTVTNPSLPLTEFETFLKDLWASSNG